jgi:hypothetical protein
MFFSHFVFNYYIDYQTKCMYGYLQSLWRHLDSEFMLTQSLAVIQVVFCRLQNSWKSVGLTLSSVLVSELFNFHNTMLSLWCCLVKWCRSPEVVLYTPLSTNCTCRFFALALYRQVSTNDVISVNTRNMTSCIARVCTVRYEWRTVMCTTVYVWRK